VALQQVGDGPVGAERAAELAAGEVGDVAPELLGDAAVEAEALAGAATSWGVASRPA
jgi:hypothetical protein